MRASAATSSTSRTSSRSTRTAPSRASSAERRPARGLGQLLSEPDDQRKQREPERGREPASDTGRREGVAERTPGCDAPDERGGPEAGGEQQQHGGDTAIRRVTPA